jgi:hypothetical protein
MNEKDYFHQRPAVRPMIYAYSERAHPGCLKIGYTARDVDKRLQQQYPVKRPEKPYKIVVRESAIRSDGTTFTDRDVHRVLKKIGVERPDGEWFRCDAATVREAIVAVATGRLIEKGRDQAFAMRPEQAEAVRRTAEFFRSLKSESPLVKPKFLWNAKMRFGKTFAAYQLAKEMEFKKILVLTFKPAVQSAWREDLSRHADFSGWQFIARPGTPSEPKIDEQYEQADKTKPIVCFGSFQDFLGLDKKTQSIKPKNEWVHTTNWDLVVFDEYHFGAWRDNAQKLFEEHDEEKEYNFKPDEEKSEKELAKEAEVVANAQDESWLPITSDHYLYLSGTPFRALNSGEFMEEQIFSWTYSDEQRAKKEWSGPEPNPYAALPRLIMMTYKVPDSISKFTDDGQFNEFDLNEFFAASGKGDSAVFKYADYVQKWLDLIRGDYKDEQIDDLRKGANKEPMPFSDVRLLNVLSHTFWFLPSVASCYAMRNLLKQKQNRFYHDYKVNVCAGPKAGTGVKALEPVLKSMKNSLESKTITLSCGKLTTGVTVGPWTGIFMLRNLSSPETYFQAAFRVQSPWEVEKDDEEYVVVKETCYVFDFALDRALKQIADYSCQLSVEEKSPEKKVAEFISFLPVLAYDGATMREINAAEILDFTMAGTSATMLARRWESALLVNVDNNTLTRLMNNEEAMAALMNIEGLRNLNHDIETIINKTEKVKKAKKDGEIKDDKKKKELTAEEKELKSKRREIQEKLIKFATRIPIFMYLSEHREECLRDVIELLEPSLFEKVTGLTVEDFELLCSLGVFNGSLMDGAVYYFKRYEDASLTYTGINPRKDDKTVGGFESVISVDEFKRLYQLQQDSLT